MRQTWKQEQGTKQGRQYNEYFVYTNKSLHLFIVGVVL